MLAFQNKITTDVFDELKKIQSLQDIGYHIEKERSRTNELFNGIKKYADDEIARYN